MIYRVFMRENVGFKEARLDIEGGLTVFTGLSGAGKSVLFRGILSAFGLVESEAKFVELSLDDKLDLNEFGIEEDDELIFKMLKDKSAKYFINSQSINKKSLMNLSKSFVKYLSVKDSNEFQSEKLLILLDALEMKQNPSFAEFKQEFASSFKEFSKLQEALQKVNEEERRVEELKELASLQIQKIEDINPKIGEYEELMALKKKLAKKDKIEEAWSKARAIFELEPLVIEALNLSEVKGDFFSECLNELRVIAESQSFEDLDLDIEGLLDRIERLSGLIKRYESIENALVVLEEKKKELAHYENLSFEKKELQAKISTVSNKLQGLSNKLTSTRKSHLKELENLINSYLSKLYMKDLSLKLEKTELCELGKDEVQVSISDTRLKNLSSGELNRLRLAFIATQCFVLNSGKGLIFLDEIDANLSGKEAMSIGKVLKELSSFYQIFAISHLPQLSSIANNHFLVEKKDKQSFVKKLNSQERINELARMVSGDKITSEAIEFAKTLLVKQN
ncbi:DNA recombination protein RecN [Campylobacter troglodytis]|nr:AAA family ATPase [Campylobacter troglodytis]TQR60583.1 DNA recombination protein RecN [Campylobacter troglodytis]